MFVSPPSLRHRARRGNVVVILAFSMVGLLTIGAIVIDVSWARMARLQAQAAADAGAHAGASRLDGSSAGISQANALSDAVIAEHWMDAAPIEAVVRTPGVWDPDTRTFTASNVVADVNAYHTETARPNLGLFFGGVTGRLNLSVGAEATALVNYRGAGGVDCYLPLAMPECIVNTAGGREGLDDYDLLLNSATLDTAGWALVNQGTNTANLRTVLNSQCAGGEVQVDQNVNLGNGVNATLFPDVATLVQSSTTRWDAAVYGALPARQSFSAITVANYGKVLEGPIIVFDDGGSGCDSNAQFNQSKPIVAFVWGAIYDVRVSGGAADKNFKIRLDTSRRSMGTRPGGDDLGIAVVGAGTLVE